MRALLLALLPTSLLAAENPMSAPEFEAYTTGKTLSYATEGASPYGEEEYLPGRRVRWAFSEDECKEGFWYEEPTQGGPLICFVYEDNASPQCWSFFRTPGGLRALFENREDSSPLYTVRESEEPLFCPGPQIGV